MSDLPKLPYERPTLSVKLNSTMTGHTVIAHRYDTAFLLKLRRGEATEIDIVEAFIAAVVDHSFPVPITELDPADMTAAAGQWLDAIRGAALPPTTGRRSPKRSPGRRSMAQDG